MKADVSYNDFRGTSAADISDHTDLNEFLRSRGVDTDRYQAIGASFYAGYEDFFSASILCLDKEKSTPQKPHTVKLGFEKDIKRKEFFGLFKRMSVVLLLDGEDYGQGQKDYTDDELSINEEGEQS